MKFGILVIVTVVFTITSGLLFNLPTAWSQVGVIQEEPKQEEEQFSQIILQLVGNKCDANLNESEILGVHGVVGVDVESMPGKIIVGFDPKLVTKKQIMEAVGKREGGCSAAESGTAFINNKKSK